MNNNFFLAFQHESGYHPQVEQISPTGPEAPNEGDDVRSTKEELLQKITKVDREIAKAESQIAKLKKKQQELVETQAHKPGMSDTNEDEDEEKPKNQSIAQTIYAENRVRLQRLRKFCCNVTFFVCLSETRPSLPFGPGQVCSVEQSSVVQPAVRFRHVSPKQKKVRRRHENKDISASPELHSNLVF